MSNQSDRQQSVRDTSGTSGNLTEDWLAFFDSEGIGAGTFNERLLLWLNQKNSASDTSLNVAKARYAAAQGVATWNDVTSIDPITPVSGNNRTQEDGTTRIQEDGTTRTLEAA